MINDPALRVDIAAEFVGKKAFKDADTAAKKLDKTVKQLGRTLGITLGASAMSKRLPMMKRQPVGYLAQSIILGFHSARYRLQTLSQT
jgi:hypothetical protein